MKEYELSNIEAKALREIRNLLIHKGRTPSVRELMRALRYRSPRSAALIIDKLIDKGILRRKPDDSFQIIKNLKDDNMRAQTIDVPLVGTVACGTPVLAEENIEALIPVSIRMAKPPHKYFLLKTSGDSMNEAGINDGDLVLVRQQVTADNGDKVVALIDDESAIKELQISDDAIILKPKSTNKKHQPIILTRDFKIQGVVVAKISSL